VVEWLSEISQACMRRGEQVDNLVEGIGVIVIWVIEEGGQ
jgi:hypothetical protein